MSETDNVSIVQISVRQLKKSRAVAHADYNHSTYEVSPRA